MNFDKGWIALFAIIVGLWALVLTSTLYPWLNGIEVLVDNSVDLSFFTLPLLGFNLLYTFLLIFVFSVYLVSFKKVKEKQISLKSKAEYNGNELCTIVIPARNEESVIGRTIKNCLQQTYKNIEVIVVCHNSTDRTFDEAQIDDPRVKAFDLTTKESGKGIALNYAVEKSSGKYILVLDADGLLSKDFIEKALPLFDENYAAVQGRYIPSNRNYNFVTKMLALEGDLWSTPYMTIRSFLEKRCPLGGTGYIIRKDVLIEEGMFANHLVDDYELTFRLLRKKHRIAFAPLSINFDEKPPTLQFMLRQRSRWIKGFIDLLRFRITEPGDLIGGIYWLSPIAAIVGLVTLLIPAYAALHYLIFDYYPFTYTFIPLEVWFVLTGAAYSLQTLVLTKEYGRMGLKYALYLPLLTPFSHYWFATFLKSLFVKSWSNTKTTHGFLDEARKEKIVSNA